MGVAIVDKNFILKFVDGNGEIIENLDKEVSYQVTFKEAYYLALKDGEYECNPPDFIKYKK